MAINKGFIKDWLGNTLLPITRGELILDKDGNAAFESTQFLAADGHPGLVTAAERAMLTGTGSGGTGGIADIYTKLEHINSGLSFKNTPVNFYDSTGKATPIRIVPATGIEIGVADNTISIGLSEVISETTVTNILKSITVDKYGRVTAVSGAALTNAEIPTELTGKTIKDSTITNGVTGDTEIGTDEKAIANKAYVDKKFREVTGIATGALKFGGPLNNATFAEAALTNKDYWYNYFKVTDTFELDTSDLYDSTGIVTDTIKVKVGDTIIVCPENPSDTTAKFVYIPSGDDITTITVKTDTDTAIESKIGNVTLKFASPFVAVNNPVNSNTAYISLPPASASASGYLTKADWVRFNSYSTALAVSYTGEFSTGNGVYKIGTLTIGGVDTEIFGKNNKASLTLNNGATDAYNPILKFTETDSTELNITFKNAGGISIKKNGNNIEFAGANAVLSESAPYLEVKNGYQFGVKLGGIDADNKVTEGLVNFSTVHNLALQVATTTRFEIIEYTLIGTDTTKYQYGNDKLKTAITITI